MNSGDTCRDSSAVQSSTPIIRVWRFTLTVANISLMELPVLVLFRNCSVLLDSISYTHTSCPTLGDTGPL